MTGDRLKILVIDDNPDDRALAVRELSRGFPGVEVTEVADRPQFERVMAGGPYDVVVTDYQLQWGDGISVLRAVKSRWPDVPVVMFTASGSEEVAVEAMKAGLDDYVIKSHKRFVRLNLAVLTCLRTARASRRATLLEVRQQVLLNRLAVGVCRLSLGGELLECNPAFLRLCGADSLEDARELDLSPLLPDAARRAYLLAHPSDNGYHAEWEATLARPDGGGGGGGGGGGALSVSVNATLSTAAATAGGGGHVLDCVVEDVTSRKKLVDDLRAASRAKDQLLALVSHELRTPLTPVLAAVSAMEADRRLPDDLLADVRMVRRNVELEARLVGDLLDLTGTVTGEVRLHFETVDAHAAVRHALEAIGPALDEKRVAVRLALDAPNPHVWADPLRVRQVLSNLLVNAAKFTAAPGTITVATAAETGLLLVRVSDTGIGIAPEHLPHIFEAFNQGDPAVTRRYGGLGLGLSVAKRIIDAHGGDLAAESEGRDRGSTFTLRLKSVDAAAAAETAPGRAAGGAAAARPPSRVLLVEDHDDTRRLMSRLLRSLGYDVMTAATVRDAIDAAAASTFDLLLSDLGLPDGTGWDLMRRVAREHAVPGIALSGFGAEDDVRRSEEAGFAAHLTKPIDLATLDAVIRQHAKRAPGG